MIDMACGKYFDNVMHKIILVLAYNLESLYHWIEFSNIISGLLNQAPSYLLLQICYLSAPPYQKSKNLFNLYFYISCKIPTKEVDYYPRCNTNQLSVHMNLNSSIQKFYYSMFNFSIMINFFSLLPSSMLKTLDRYQKCSYGAVEASKPAKELEVRWL